MTLYHALTIQIFNLPKTTTVLLTFDTSMSFNLPCGISVVSIYNITIRSTIYRHSIYVISIYRLTDLWEICNFNLPTDRISIYSGEICNFNLSRLTEFQFTAGRSAISIYRLTEFQFTAGRSAISIHRLTEFQFTD